MKNMIRALALAAMLAGSFTTAAAAQDGPEPRSKISGLSLGAFVHHVTGDFEGSDESGTGLGLHVGYGFGEFVAAFVRGGMAPNESYVGGPGFELAHFDLGIRVSPGASSWPIRPFVQGALTERQIHLDHDMGRARGLGFTGGVGAEYFFRRNLAIEAGISRSFGDLTDFDGPGLDNEEDDLDLEVNTTRIEVGISWHP